jgi:penicillin-binding protein 2
VTTPTRPESTQVRLTILAVVVACLFAALFARLWYLQVISGTQAQAAAQNQGVRIVYTPAPRGRILDRNGVPIVDNRISEVVTLSRDTAKRDPDVLARLSTLLAITPANLQRSINDQRFSPYAPVPVAQDVDTSKIIYIKEHQDEFPGVDATAEAVRSYMPAAAGMIAANIVGYVGQITDKELAQRKKEGYLLGDQIGQTGVEAAYEDALRGQPGVTKLQVDSQGRVLGVLGSQPPVQGHDVWLSIDLNVQKLAEESLAQGLAAVQQTTDKAAGGPGDKYVAPAGAAVVLDPRDGSVLALATNPTYTPADFVGGISTARFAYYQDPNNNFPLDDRTIQGEYAPGSTFKLVTALAGLRNGIITPTTPFVDKGFLQVGPTRFNNDNKQIYGTVNLQRALTVSSDAYFYNIGATLWEGRTHYGDDALQNAATDLGFGTPTGIPLPNESGGRIPDQASRKKLHAENPKAFPNGDWFTGDNVNTAIGQGDVAVTPLQLANAYATFANGGTVWQPRIALKITDQAGKVVQALPPLQTRHVDLPGAWRDPMLAGFEGVVSDGDGTAHAAFVGFPLAVHQIAGKTGTAQVQGKQPTSVFASFAPAANPTFVVTAFMEQAGYGADAAAPVVRRIYEGLFGLPILPVTLPKSGVD